MAITIYSSATVYAANALTILRGTSADILEVLVYHDQNPNVIPVYANFTAVQLVEAPDPLAEGDYVDVLSKIGPGVAALVDAGEVTLTAGDWQRFVGIRTADEFVITSVDTVMVL